MTQTCIQSRWHCTGIS